MVSSIEILTVQEAAEILKCTPAHIYNLVKEGVLPSLRLGKSVRIPAKALREWMEANTQPGREVNANESLAGVG